MTRIPADPERRISIPEEASQRLGIEPSDVLELELEVEDDRLIIRKPTKLPVSAFRGLFKVEGAPDLDWREVREIAWREQTRRLARGNPANRE